MNIVFNRLWVDSDEMLQVELFLEGNGYAATQDFYLYSDTLKIFGRKLQEFPSSVSDEAILEVGSSEATHYCWAKLRAYVYDGSGHTALELCTKRNGAPHVCAQSKFSVVIEAAALNNLGLKIEKWAFDNKESLVFRSDL